ncbi:hypothetical protein JAAARDRAFT_189420 [Jaapia argillacea MUCL 33604]|uniref:Uncharacterized protein n=1 Tax=Jaapia argillacea MUCL 33604 TaxID=933084 RepID=A0A067QHG7_9AGAM|nr:hypothetical protein JAAARDRAFT_189420 [Jaapia argillacea MUCL 33604]
MKFSTALLPFVAVLATSALAIPIKRAVDPALVAQLAPPLGFVSGVNPTGTGNCDGAVKGANGQPVQVPCACPPSEAEFISQLQANVAAGFAVHNPSVGINFQTGSDSASLASRIQAGLVTLQNLNGPGQGCPAASTTLSAQLASALGGSTAGVPSAVPDAPAAAASPPPAPAASPAPAPPAAPPAAPAAPADGTASAAQVAALAPPLGFSSGVNPTGTGNCDGAVIGANGKPVQVPCSCPPPQSEYIAQLQANVAAGEAVNNPSVKISFPVGNDNASQAARIEAALVTIQNLNGPGVGCPAASTTLSAQLKAVQ